VVEPRYRVLDVARALQVPREQIWSWVKVKPGDRVHKGDVLAERKQGLWPKTVTAPETAEVVVVDEGLILLRLRASRFALTAGFPGEVTRVYPQQGVEITVRGALIDGLWGNGKVEYGLMRLAAERPEEPLTPDHLSVAMRGLIVVGGACTDAKVLEMANELPLRALVVSSLRAALVPYALRMRIPLLVLEGFGRFPLPSAVFQLLKSHEQREVAVVAETPDRHQGVRPQVIIPLDVPHAPETPEVEPVRQGQKVRLVRPVEQGATGVVARVLQGWRPLPHGVRARVVEVRAAQGAHRMVVPLNNLEILT